MRDSSSGSSLEHSDTKGNDKGKLWLVHGVVHNKNARMRGVLIDNGAHQQHSGIAGVTLRRFWLSCEILTRAERLSGSAMHIESTA